MQKVLFTNITIIDATGAEPYRGEVLVVGNRIEAIAREQGTLSRDQTKVIDIAGTTLMPGLIESHAHLSLDQTEDIVKLGLMPPEEHTLLTMHNARLYLDHGITSCISAGAVKPRLDVVIRNAINAGQIPGPRLLAATPWLTVTGGLGDKRALHAPYIETMAMMVDGPEAYRRVSREMVREGVDIIKLVVSGESFLPHAGPYTTPMNEDEIAAAAAVARAHGKQLSAHAKNAESIKRCIRNGVKIIYHANYADEEAIDLLEEHKDRIFVGPTIAYSVIGSHEVSHLYTEKQIVASGVREELEGAIKVMPELKKRGVRLLGGGDYGFSLIPHGQNARDIEHFIRYLDFTPMEALLTMTRYGAEAMNMGGELGQIKPGYLADLLLIDGDPLLDPSLLTKPGSMLAIMKDGVFHKQPTKFSIV